MGCLSVSLTFRGPNLARCFWVELERAYARLQPRWLGVFAQNKLSYRVPRGNFSKRYYRRPLPACHGLDSATSFSSLQLRTDAGWNQLHLLSRHRTRRSRLRSARPQGRPHHTRARQWPPRPPRPHKDRLRYKFPPRLLHQTVHRHGHHATRA